MENAPKIGGKVRRLRRQKKLSQAALAEQLGISASYLNLIEHNRRKITVTMLFKLAKFFGVETTELIEGDEARIAHDLLEVFSDDLFMELDITNMDVRDLASSNPPIAKAILHLYDALQKVKKNPSASATGNNVDLGLVREPVSDFIQQNSNYFPTLESAAERIRSEFGFNNEDRKQGLISFLLNAFGIQTQFRTFEGGVTRYFDPQRSILQISRSLSAESTDFQLALQTALFSANEQISVLIDGGEFITNDARALARTSLAAYVAGAILMPYDQFLKKAKETRYDIELLASQFSVSFEQAAHRLTSLQKPGASGVPFHLVRTDIAGNISKRFSLSGIHIPRHRGACPRWNVYSAFLQPGMINIQISEMPDGKRFFCIARTLMKGENRYGAPVRHLSIGLGCDISHAKQLVYADDVNITKPRNLVPIGVSCRICPRLECTERAFPPSTHKLNLDENRRGVSAYVSV